MNRKKENRKPPTGRTEGGGNENELSGNVFYAYCKTKPAEKQTDYAKQADVFKQQANYFEILARIANLMRLVTELQDEAKLTLSPIYAGGTIYQIPGGTYED